MAHRRTAAAMARADAGRARCSAPRVRAAVRKRRYRFSLAAISLCIARIASSNAAETAAAGTAADQAAGVGTEVPRRQQRRPTYRKGAPKAPREDSGALDASARRVLAAHGGDPRRLEALVRDLQQVRDEADRLAFQDPSPDALREYRRTSRELAEAQRAFAMASSS